MRRRKPFRRRVAEAWSALVGGGGAFAGAQTTRLTFDWARAPISADKEIYGSLGKLRARGRDLARNNAHAAQALRLYADNIVGPKGVSLQCRIRNNRGRLVEELNAQVETAWKEWGRSEFCTVNGKASWVDVQRYVMQLVPGEGEAFIRIIENGQGPFGIALQMLDADLLDEDFNQAAGKNSNEIRMSVEVDTLERPVAYHFLTRHPTALNRNEAGQPPLRIRVPARDIIHLHREPRLGQTRGVTWFAPVMLNLRMLGAYQEAEVVAARIAASKVGILYTDPAAYGPPLNEEPFPEPQSIDIEPGSLWQPLPGQRIEGWNPDHPTQQYRDFVKGMLQSVASGLGLSYASLAGDLEGTSYASGRTGLLQERDHYRALQGWLVEHLHRRVFERWLAMAVLTGRIDMARQGDILAAVAWQPRGWSWVDPSSDAKASEMEIANGLNSRSDILAEQGKDFEEVIDALAAENEMAKAKGVDLTVSPPVAAPSAA